MLVVGASNTLERFMRIRLDRDGRGGRKKPALPPIDYHI
jgi:hypothetical protein